MHQFPNKLEEIPGYQYVVLDLREAFARFDNHVAHMNEIEVYRDYAIFEIVNHICEKRACHAGLSRMMENMMEDLQKVAGDEDAERVAHAFQDLSRAVMGEYERLGLWSWHDISFYRFREFAEPGCPILEKYLDDESDEALQSASLSRNRQQTSGGNWYPRPQIRGYGTPYPRG